MIMKYLPLNKMTKLYEAAGLGYSLHDPATINGFIELFSSGKKNNLEKIAKDSNIGFYDPKKKILNNLNLAFEGGVSALSGYSIATVLSFVTPIVTPIIVEPIENKLDKIYSVLW